MDFIKRFLGEIQATLRIEFVKDINGCVTVVTYNMVASKQDLHIQTMCKSKTKKSLAPLKDAKSSLNAPNPADTSKTRRGTALNNSIAGKKDVGKNKFALSDADYQQLLERGDMDAAQRMVLCPMALLSSLRTMKKAEKTPAGGIPLRREAQAHVTTLLLIV
ncbi:MAG: hypothetical protein IJX84_04725 [Clostridia bacterium]|nr:hypothetical protein [Clostridia bacterium]